MTTKGTGGERPLLDRALYQRIESGRPDALACLEQVLERYPTDAAWSTRLKIIYTVVDAVTGCPDPVLREALLDRLQATYPPGHLLWSATGHLAVKNGLGLLERYLANGLDPRLRMEDGRSLLRQVVLATPGQAPAERFPGAFDVFDRLLDLMEPSRRALEIADAWQYAVMGVNPRFMAKILSVEPIDVNAPMLGDIRRHGMERPMGNDAVIAIMNYWRSFGTDETRFREAFRLLAFQGLEWWTVPTDPGVAPASRWDFVEDSYRARVRQWHEEAQREMKARRLEDALPPAPSRSSRRM